MATLFCHFPNFTSLSSHKNLIFSSPFPLQTHLQIHHLKNPNNFCIVSASSLNKPRVSKKKVKKTNADLCNDIKEFLSSTGFPQDHVPSLKELSRHGRQDLANIVRRRGYKFIKQLLETPTTRNFNDSTIEGQNEKPEVVYVDLLPSEVVQETDNELKLNGQSSLTSELSTLILEEKVARFIQDGELDNVEDCDLGISNEGHVDEAEDARETLNGKASSFMNSYISTEDRASDEMELNVGKNPKMENQAEINRLKFLLHQKELELTQLKQLIEKEKLALSILQTKAETEITKAQELISEKESELYAAEENLFGLKEVEIQYTGDGENVEVAGSFNGWHQRIKMEPQQPSSIASLPGSRTSQIWTAVLWLYPGVYEMKFIIDGNWRTDPQRETITHGTVNNNILRVDK